MSIHRIDDICEELLGMYYTKEIGDREVYALVLTVIQRICNVELSVAINEALVDWMLKEFPNTVGEEGIELTQEDETTVH